MKKSIVILIVVAILVISIPIITIVFAGILPLFGFGGEDSSFTKSDSEICNSVKDDFFMFQNGACYMDDSTHGKVLRIQITRNGGDYLLKQLFAMYGSKSSMVYDLLVSGGLPQIGETQTILLAADEGEKMEIAIVAEIESGGILHSCEIISLRNVFSC